MRWVNLAWSGVVMTMLAFAALQVQAADAIVATQDRATIVKLPKDAANIIIGNPAYFEVTLEDPRTLILFGKSPGQTNMIIWDDKRHDILNTMVVVLPDHGATSLRVYSAARGASGAMETTYACAKGKCVRTSEGATGGTAPATPPPDDGNDSGSGSGGSSDGPASPPPGTAGGATPPAGK